MSNPRYLTIAGFHSNLKLIQGKKYKGKAESSIVI